MVLGHDRLEAEEGVAGPGIRFYPSSPLLQCASRQLAEVVEAPEFGTERFIGAVMETYTDGKIRITNHNGAVTTKNKQNINPKLLRNTNTRK